MTASQLTQTQCDPAFPSLNSNATDNPEDDIAGFSFSNPLPPLDRTSHYAPPATPPLHLGLKQLWLRSERA